ncbi:restriction endonuclease subunit S [Pseudomonas kribbensis]|uniref:restriction endonuclease subunit S n=1 Tax=Pseudomonas kribbensis TaxID=1628086 RepID=UPI003BF855C9
MKARWVTQKIGEIAKTQYGLSESMNADGNGFKIFRMGEVQNGQLIDTGNMKYADISEQEFERYRLSVGDVLFNRTNSFELVGKTGIFLLEGDYCFASYLVRLNLDRKKILPQFLNYLMNSDGFQKSVKAKASKSINQANINAKILSNELICFPDTLSEQQRIVDILDDAFGTISTGKVNAKNNLKSARDLFKSHAQSVFARQGDGWKINTLDKVSKNLDSRRVPITKSDRKSGEYPYYGASGVVDYVADYIFDGDALLVSEDGANLLARSTPIAFSVCGQYWVNNHAHILEFQDMATQRFVEFYLESIPLDKYVTGAAQPKLNQKALYSIPIPMPESVDDQRLVVNMLEALTVETERLEEIYQQKLAAFDELQKSVLNKAFSGAL